ncbi:MAG: YceD family protein [Acidimicrobiia bacterium]
MSPEGEALVVPVGDLIGSPGKERPFSGIVSVSLRLGDARIDGPMNVSGKVIGLIDAVEADYQAAATAQIVCTRCLTEWEAPVTVESKQYFRTTLDEDGYGIVHDEVDVGAPARDELALALPVAPICKEGCLGLCPTCGTDLNSDPCGGHGEDSDSPFAALKDLFDS